MYLYMPELWKQLQEMDKKSFRKFRADYSIEELTKKFQKESGGIKLWE